MEFTCHSDSPIYLHFHILCYPSQPFLKFLIFSFFDSLATFPTSSSVCYLCFLSSHLCVIFLSFCYFLLKIMINASPSFTSSGNIYAFNSTEHLSGKNYQYNVQYKYNCLKKYTTKEKYLSNG